MSRCQLVIKTRTAYLVPDKRDEHDDGLLKGRQRTQVRGCKTGSSGSADAEEQRVDEFDGELAIGKP